MSFRTLALAHLSLVALSGCVHSTKPAPIPRNGTWRMELDLDGAALPFQFDLQREKDTAWVARIHNATESILVNDIELREDTFVMRMPLFDSEFRGIVRNDSMIEGAWCNHLKGPDYRIPFVARAGQTHRFNGPADGEGSFAGTWEAHFSKGTPDAYNAIGLFEQQSAGRVTGTFVTETGDYRFLEGSVHADSMRLSCFDGSHAFLFTAKLTDDSIAGHFWSGTHWQEPWVARRNPDFKLRHPDSLTFLKEGYDMADFSFPDLEGKPVSPRDARFKGKVLMLQVMGSWCPNCVDETVLLKELYDIYTDQGLEVIALAFEKYSEEERAITGLKRFRNALGIQYPMVYAGMASKEQAAAKLPFLDHVMSYPTCVFVDRAGKVRRIHTDFYGPSTGQHHENYKRTLRSFVEQLLAEPAPSEIAQKNP